MGFRFDFIVRKEQKKRGFPLNRDVRHLDNSSNSKNYWGTPSRFCDSLEKKKVRTENASGAFLPMQATIILEPNSRKTDTRIQG